MNMERHAPSMVVPGEGEGGKPRRKRPGRDWVIGLLLFAALVAAYWPALHGGFLWDDESYISENQTLLTAAGLRAIWVDPSATCQYYPLSFTFFWTIHHFFGFETFAFHLATLLAHGTGAILFWKVLERLRVRGALLAAAIFALHPVNVMSVAWMCELKNTLSCALALGAALAYLRFAGVGMYGQMSAKARGWRWFALSLVLFQLAMLAKTAVSFLPVTLLLVLWWQRERLTRRDVLMLLPMLGISVAMGALTIYIERHGGGASGAQFNIGFLDRILISGRSFWFYLFKLVWPARLTFIYPRWKLDAGAWWQWLYPIATVAVIAGTWMARRRIGKGPFVALTHFYVATSFLILAVVPFMTMYTFVADHWAYFGSLGIAALAASVFARAMDRMEKEWDAPLETGVGITVVCTLAVLTWAQCGMYSDSETLWATTLAENPDCWAARSNLGMADLQQGSTGEAITQIREALRMNPANAQAHNNLAGALMQENQIDQAIVEYREAVRLQPEYEDAHYNLGTALLDEGRVNEAANEYRAALRLNPGDEAAHNGLGKALIGEGQTQGAIAEFGSTVRIDPGDAQAHENLAQALLSQGQAAEAIQHAEKALALQPSDANAKNVLAWMLAASPEPSLRDGTRAVQLATQALDASGGENASMLRTLAAAYAQTGQYPIAAQTARRALALLKGQNNVADALRREIKLYEAGHAYEAAH